MNTHFANRLAHETRRELLADPAAYVESVGKDDILALGEAANSPRGTGTVLRLILGASECIPLRALTYVDSALRIAGHIPHEQIQIVHANRLGATINNVNLAQCQKQTVALGGMVRAHIGRHHPELEHRVLHAEDTPMELEHFAEIADQALRQNPHITQKLLAKGAKHGGNPARYASAHFAFQDTDTLVLEPLHNQGPAQACAERIVSIGCQQERTFYLARMAMRSAAFDYEMPLISTAQVFTKHLTPPYFVARGGEPLLGEADFSSLQLDAVGDPGARRDLVHFVQTSNERGL